MYTLVITNFELPIYATFAVPPILSIRANILPIFSPSNQASARCPGGSMPMFDCLTKLRSRPIEHDKVRTVRLFKSLGLRWSPLKRQWAFSPVVKE